MMRCWRVAASPSMLWREDRQFQASLFCFFVEPLSGDLVGLAKLEPDRPAFRTEQQAPQALAKSRQTLLHVVRHLDVQRHDPGAFFPGSLEDLAVLDPAHPVRSDRHVFGLLARPAAFEMCDEALLSLEKFHHPFHRTPVESPRLQRVVAAHSNAAQSLMMRRRETLEEVLVGKTPHEHPEPEHRPGPEHQRNEKRFDERRMVCDDQNAATSHVAHRAPVAADPDGAEQDEQPEWDSEKSPEQHRHDEAAQERRESILAPPLHGVYRSSGSPEFKLLNSGKER